MSATPGSERHPADTATATETATETAVDELTRLVLDELGPVVVAYRREVARRAGLHPDDLVCLDVLRRLGPQSAGVLAGWIGVTRSPMSKTLRRLEAGGHLDRSARSDRRQGIDVAWRPHAARDAVLAELRGRVRRDVAGLVADQRLDDRDRLALAAKVIVGLQNMMVRHSRELDDAVADARFREHRRRMRAADPSRW